MKAIKPVSVCVLMAGIAMAPWAHGSIVTYTARSDFEAASSALQTIDFEGLAPADGYHYYGSSLKLSGVTFTSPSSLLFVFGPNAYVSSGALNIDIGPSGGLGVSLPKGTTAFGADFSRLFGSPDVTVTFFGGESFSFKADAAPGSTFYGFTSDQPMVSLIYAAQYKEVIDNVSFGVAAVPEPSTYLAGILASVALLGTFVRRIRK